MVFDINNAGVKCPSEMTPGYSDVDKDSHRNANGKLIRDRVRGGTTAVRKLTLVWYWLTQEECTRLLQSVHGENFPVKFYDPDIGAVVTRTMYVGDRVAPCYTRYNGEEGYKKTAFNLIEI